MWLKKKSDNNKYCWEYGGTWTFLLMGIKWSNFFFYLLGNSYKRSLPLEFSNSTSRHYFKNEICPYLDFYRLIHSNFTHSSPNWKHPMFLSTEKQMTMNCSIHTMAYYSAITRIDYWYVQLRGWCQEYSTEWKKSDM